MPNGRRAVRRVARRVGAHFRGYYRMGAKLGRMSGLSLGARRAIVRYGFGAAFYYEGRRGRKTTVKPISPRLKLRKRSLR